MHEARTIHSQQQQLHEIYDWQSSDGSFLVNTSQDPCKDKNRREEVFIPMSKGEIPTIVKSLKK